MLDKTELDRLRADIGPDGATKGENDALLYRAHSPVTTGDAAASMPRVARELTFAGRTWEVHIAGAIEPASGTAWVALALGIGLSLFVAVALGALAESRRSAVR